MKRIFAFFAVAMLVSCIAERIISPKPEPAANGPALSITIPGGFAVQSTRGVTNAQEVAIADLRVLVYTGGGGGALESVHEVDLENDLEEDEDTPNKYTITNLTLPSTGTHRIVMLANAAELDLGQPDGVAVGDIEWSRTNSITDLGGTATFQSTPYVYDSYDLQPTWDQATGGISENTAAGVCPPNWRLPTRLEAIDLLSPSISTSVWVNDAGPGGNIAGRQVTISADGQTLFFSASGYSSNYQGNGAEFWTSTMRNVSNAFSLDFAEAPNIASVNNNSKGYHFSIRCVRPAGGTRSLTRAGVGDVAVGQTYDQVREAMVGALAGKPYPAPTDAANDYSIPMWGEDEYEGETTTVIDIALRRSLARVDVGVGAWDDDDNNWAGLPSVFEMTDVVVVHPNDKYSLIPDPASLSVDNPATADTDESGAPSSPSVPTGTAQFSPEDSFAYSGAVMANEIYLPEAVLAGVADTDRMALIIGGHYRGSADVTWYRVDFRLADGSLTDVVRNHLYRFSITSVSSPGLPDIEQAYNSVRSSMSVSVVDWNEVVFAPGL